MNKTELIGISDAWDDMTHRVLNLEELPLCEIQDLLKDTYSALTFFHKDDLVPKEISRVLLRLDEFLYFTSMMEENERGFGYYHWQEIFLIVEALKKGFFNAKYDYAYPKLNVCDPLDQEVLLDLEENRLEDYIRMINSMKAPEE